MKRLTHYEILGIHRNADEQEIKYAYKKLAFQYHPDKNPENLDAEEKFKKITLSYEVLSDPDKRRAYDLGFDTDSGIFNPDFIDPSLLDPDEFIKTFVSFFGDYLDEKVPGGFRSRVNRAAKNLNNSVKKSQKKCNICMDKKRIPLQQGSLVVYVSCRACA